MSTWRFQRRLPLELPLLNLTDETEWLSGHVQGPDTAAPVEAEHAEQVGDYRDYRVILIFLVKPFDQDYRDN